MYQKLDEDSGTENVDFEVLNTRLDSHEVSSPDLVEPGGLQSNKGHLTYQLLYLQVGTNLQPKASKNNGLDLVFTSKTLSKRIKNFNSDGLG